MGRALTTAILPTVTVIAPRVLRFRCGGEECVGDLWLPGEAHDAPLPAVVLGHGLGATRAMGLSRYAERFAAAGLAAFTFDYRSFGDSDGEPREIISIPGQLEDWRAAIAFVRTLPEIDASRVAAWGTSFGGGHVLRIAATDPSLAAAVAQCPFTDGPAAMTTLGPRSTLKVARAAVADLVAAVRGRPPVRVDCAGPPNSAALMTARDALPGYERIAALSGAPARPVAARFGLAVGTYRPGRDIARIAVPTLVCVCDPDTVAPTRATMRHLRRASNPRVTSRTYSCGHFAIYFDEPFEAALADQLSFLGEHLLGQAGVHAEPAVGSPSTPA